MENFQMIAKTFQGLEEILAQEITELGADEVQIGRRMVSFTGDKALLYRANYCLRTAIRVLKPIATFRAANPDEVYSKVKAIDWSKFLNIHNTFAIDSVVYSEEFSHSKFVAYRVKDAIADFFRESTGERPNVSISHPQIRINLHIAGRDCTLSLDASGESLHLRGWRVATVEAPINEVLAAGLVRLSGWTPERPLVDPFCGSGTLLIEAAQMASGIPAGRARKAYGFQNWNDFDAALFERVKQEAEQGVHPCDALLFGFDLKRAATEAAKANAQSADVEALITFTTQDIADFDIPAIIADKPAFLLSNPPYGERLRPERLLPLYETLGKVLKQQFQGGEAWIISMHRECFDAIGLRPSFRIPLDNGSLACEFRKYQLFKGKLDDFRREGGVVKTDYERRRMAEKGRFKKRDREKPLFQRTEPAERPQRPRNDDHYVPDEDFTPEYARLRAQHRLFLQKQRDQKPRTPRRPQGGRRKK